MKKNHITLSKKEDSIFLGVCGGIANHFKIDPFFVRAIFVLFSLFYGVGLFPYILVFCIMPQHPADKF